MNGLFGQLWARKLNGGWLRTVALGRSAGQTYSLFVSELANTGLSFINTAVLTRILGPEEFGAFAFYLRMTTFVLLFWGFGFAHGIGVLLSQRNHELEERGIIGAGLALALVIGFLYALVIFLFSFFVDDYFGTEIGVILRIASPFFIAFPAQAIIRQIGRGSNRINSIVFLNIAPGLLLLGAIQINTYYKPLSLERAILYQAGSVAVTILFLILFVLRPSYANIRQNIRHIQVKTRQYGIHMYVGQITDQASSSLDAILIPLMADVTQLGYYTLATGLVLPATNLSQTLATVQFKRLANMQRIPSRLTWLNYLWLIISCGALLIFGGPLTVFIFGESFAPVSSFLPIVVATAFLTGAYQPHNAFLVAHEKPIVGYFSLFVSPLTVLGYFFFIGRYQAYGAALVQLLKRFVWFVLFVGYYHKLTERAPLTKS